MNENHKCAVMLGGRDVDASIFSSVDVFQCCGTTEFMDGAKMPVRIAHQVALAAAVLSAAATLYFFSPEEHGFYPRCLLKSWTGLNCPFCGCLRAAHQLLHGNFQAAYALNPLFVLVLIPIFIFIVVSRIICKTSGRPLFHFALKPIFVWSCVAVLVIFGVSRNLATFQ